MIEEIIYTSAEKGLKAGSRGFCTVVSTAGMAINTAERLESMSGYRHAFPMQDPRAAVNPVNYSHVTLRIGGKNAHVVSRVADAGQDYSGRTNKLAHHLMINDVSRFAAGPARLMGEKGVLVSQWDGSIRNVPARNLPMPVIPPSIELTAWKSLTGDSGWAGWVAEQLTKDKAPVSVIFSPGTDTLLLVREVLDLLPPIQQWSITFSTYFTKLLAGTECQLRFVLDETPEATALRNDARAKVVDLQALSACTGGALVQQARSGRIAAAKQSEPSPSLNPPPARPVTVTKGDELFSAVRTASEIPAIPKGGAGGLPSAGLNERQIPSLRSLNRSAEPPRRSRAAMYAVFGLLILIAAGTGLVLYFSQAEKQNASVTNPTASETSTPRDRKRESGAGPSDHKLAATDLPSNNGQASANRSSENTSAPTVDVAPMETPLGSTASTAMPPVNSTDPAPPRPDVPKPEPLPEKIDPFALANADKRFAYPNHPDLNLFPLSKNPGNEPSPSMPLVLQDGDTVKLAFHGSFHDVINNPGGLKESYDIELSEPVTDQNGHAWTARLLQAGKEVSVFGKYELRHPSQEKRTHLLTFIPGELFTSDKQTEIGLAYLLPFCPLVVSVKSSDSDRIQTQVFAQRRGAILPAEGTMGLQRHSRFDEPNIFRHLQLFAPRQRRAWSLNLDIVTILNRTRVSYQVPFTERTAAKDFYTPLHSASTELEFNPNSVVADGELGFVLHGFTFKLNSDEIEKDAFFQFTASKLAKGRLRLPWMPGRLLSVVGDDRGTSLLQGTASKLGDRALIESLRLFDDPELRLLVDDSGEEAFIYNEKRLQAEISQAKNSLVNQNAIADKAIAAEEAKKEQRNMPEIERQNAIKDEITIRINALTELGKRYNMDMHNKHREAYKGFQSVDKEYRIGYEVFLELISFQDDGRVHPATKVYLIETSFEEQQ